LFGTNGVATFSFGSQNSQIGGVAIQTDGKIVVAGSTGRLPGRFRVAR